MAGPRAAYGNRQLVDRMVNLPKLVSSILHEQQQLEIKLIHSNRYHIQMISSCIICALEFPRKALYAL